MNIQEAQSKGKLYLTTGLIISFVAAVMMTMGSLLTIYNIAIHNNAVMLHPLMNMISNLVAKIYEATSWLSWLWNLAPLISFPNVFVPDNLGIASILSVFTIGIVMRDSGFSLLRRVNKVTQRAEEKRWENSLNGEPITSENIKKIEVAKDPKDTWYTRPAGIIALTVIGGYLVNLLSKVTGLM